MANSENVCLIFQKAILQSFGKLLFNPLGSFVWSVGWNGVVLQTAKEFEIPTLNVMLGCYLEGDSESRYGEVATLTEQVCPGNCYRQVLETEIAKACWSSWLVLYEKKTCMYPSTNSTGKSASSIRQLMVRMLRATLLRDIAPSTESWMQSKVKWK